MRNDQLDKFDAFAGHVEGRPAFPCDLFLLSWTLTPGSFPPVPPTPWDLARRANPSLGHDIRLELARPTIPNRHGKVINLVFVDYVEAPRATDVALFLNGTPVAAADETKPLRRTAAKIRQPAKTTTRPRAKTTTRPRAKTTTQPRAKAAKRSRAKATTRRRAK